MNADKVNIILGPPGTGKTTALIGLPQGVGGSCVGVIEDALSRGVDPGRIGFISFTKKAAEEGKSRAAAKFSLPEQDLPHFRTIHSFAFKHLGCRRDQVVNWPHLKELGKMLGLDFKGRGEVADGDVYGMNSADRLLFLDGLARNAKRPLRNIWSEAFEDTIDWFELDRFAKALATFKASRMLIDYTDMLERFNSVDSKTLPEFDLLIVDEAQDLSPLQWDSVELLAYNAKTVFIAGDDEQAIYKWSGADVERFISLPGKVRTLDISYRIPSSVHVLAESISRRIGRRREKIWHPRNAIGSVNWFNNIEEIDMSKGTWLLLARNGYMLTQYENWCLMEGFSFHSINRDPLKSHSLVAIRYWESLRKGQLISAEQVIDCVRYLPTSFVSEKLLSAVRVADPSQLFSMQELRGLGLGTELIWHEALTKISPKERDFFLAARRRGEALLKEPRIQISTIHASKGGQADHVVLMTDMSYRCYNNMVAAPDDEMRVWYVATTRCKESLNLIVPKTEMAFEL